jgi:Tol biopolymer transport system component
MNADGSERRNLSRHPAHDSDPAWSPDGGRIAFLSRRDGKQEIYVVNADEDRAAEPYAQPGARVPPGLVAGRAEDPVHEKQ